MIERFEHRGQPLLPRHRFLQRVARHGLLGLGLLAAALGIGVVGYHTFAGLGWIDSIHNASMILAGMGPVDPMPTPGSKLFASAYAIFSGVVFLGTVGVFLSPIVHRFLHRFHFETDETRA